MVKIEDVISPMTFNLLMSMGAGVILGWLVKGKYGRQVELRNDLPTEEENVSHTVTQSCQ